MDTQTTFTLTDAIFAGLLALSEILAYTPLKANSVFQLVTNALRSLAGTPPGGGGGYRPKYT